MLVYSNIWGGREDVVQLRLRIGVKIAQGLRGTFLLSILQLFLDSIHSASSQSNHAPSHMPGEDDIVGWSSQSWVVP